MMSDAARARLPGFICIGGYRCGTSWLQEVLSRHSGIYLPPDKELKYFSSYWKRGEAWYTAFYDQAGPGRLAGEICPAYLAHEAAAERIRGCIPGAKLIAVCRQPVDQVESHWRLALQRRSERQGFREMVSDGVFINNVMYHLHICRFLALFPQEQLLVLLFDDLLEDPQAFLDQVCRFLGVDLLPLGQLGRQKVNQARRAGRRPLERLMAGAGEFMRRHDLYRLRGFLRSIGVVGALRSLTTGGEVAGPRLAFEDRRYVIEQTRCDTLALGRYLGRDLSPWLDVES